MSYRVKYACQACGVCFFLVQGEPEPDEDVEYCNPCTDVIFTDNAHGTADDPWTPELIRQARARRTAEGWHR